MLKQNASRESPQPKQLYDKYISEEERQRKESPSRLEVPLPSILNREVSPFRSPQLSTNRTSVFDQRSPKLSKSPPRVEDWRYKADFCRERRSSIKRAEEDPEFHLRELTKHGANPATKDFVRCFTQRGFSPLYYCVLNNNLRALQALLDLAGPLADLH